MRSIATVAVVSLVILLVFAGCKRSELRGVPRFACVCELLKWYSMRISSAVDGPGPYDSETQTTKGWVLRRKGIHRSPDLYLCPNLGVRTEVTGKAVGRLLWTTHLKRQEDIVGVSGRLTHQYCLCDSTAVRHAESGSVVGHVGIMGSVFRVGPAGEGRVQVVRQTAPRSTERFVVSCPVAAKKPEIDSVLLRSGTIYKEDRKNLYCLSAWKDRDSLSCQVVKIDVAALGYGAEVVLVEDPTVAEIGVGREMVLGDLRLIVSRIDERGWFDAEVSLEGCCSSEKE